MTDQDLRDLGVLLGHRRILLAAIAKLIKHDARMPADTAEPHTFTEGEAERLQLTVMFCDLVGSTALSTQFDAEDYRELIRRLHDTCVEPIARYDGFVAKLMGDGRLAYFGYPIAHDDDAHRATRAALEIVAKTNHLESL